MKKHNHDVHFLLIVLILAFFVMALSYRQVDPGLTSMTGQVIESSPDDRPSFSSMVVKFFRTSVSVPQYHAIDNSAIRPIEIEVSNSYETRQSNIGGNAFLAPVGENNLGTLPEKCEWVNLNNEDYSKLKALTGYSACRTMAYRSCVATNEVVTEKYYSSTDSSCNSVQLEVESNKFGNCNKNVRTVEMPCSTQTQGFDEPAKGDVKELKYTSVLCCE